MMSLRNWLALLVVYILFLMLGGYSFRALEYPTDCAEKTRELNVLKEIKRKAELIKNVLASEHVHMLNGLMSHLDNNGSQSDSPKRKPTLIDVSAPFDFNSTSNGTASDQPDCSSWDIYNSFFFAFTTITTIGYGHLYPKTSGGKILCIFYSLLGIPVNGILIGSMGTYFGNRLNKMRHRPRMKSPLARILATALECIALLVPGSVIFILAPAGIFCLIERNWTYLDSVYYAFITLTTIGLGDFVAGRDLKVLNALGDWAIVYEICICIWTFTGMAYLVLLVNVITSGAQTIKAKVDLSKIIREIAAIRSTKEKLKRPCCDGVDYLPVEKHFPLSPHLSLYSTPKPKLDDVVSIAESGRSISPLLHRVVPDGTFSPSVPPTGSLDYEDVNMDTVKSLRNFLDTNRMLRLGGGGSATNRAGTQCAAPDLCLEATTNMNSEEEKRSLSHRLIRQSREFGTGLLRIAGLASESVPFRMRSKLRIRESCIHRQIRDAFNAVLETSIGPNGVDVTSLPEFLRHTTLEEFLKAAEKVTDDERIARERMQESSYIDESSLLEESDRTAIERRLSRELNLSSASSDAGTNEDPELGLSRGPRVPAFVSVFDPITPRWPADADRCLVRMISDARDDGARENVVLTRTPAKRTDDDRGDR